MKQTLIGQEIHALTLASGDAKALLWGLPRKIVQSLPVEVCFLIPAMDLPSTSCSRGNSIAQTQLIQCEKKLKTVLWETGKTDSEENHLLAALEQEFTLSQWEVCPFAQAQRWGWLIVGSSQDLGFNGSLEVSLESALSLAVKTAYLQWELKKKERYKLLQQSVTEVIHNSQDLETLLHRAIAQTSQSLDVSRGTVFMLRYAEPIFSNRREISNPNVEIELLTQWTHGSSLESSLTSFPLSTSPLCLKAWQQAPTPLTDQQIEDPDGMDLSLSQVSHPMSSWLITPLMGTSSGHPESQMVLGFLLLENDEPRSWQPEEQELVSWVSTEVSTAIIHNKTLQRVQSLVDERTSQLQRSLEVQAKLYETSRNQVEQLKELNQLKDEFLATISHELNTPLATMKMAIQMLQNPALPPDRQQKYLGILEQEWDRESKLIKDLLTLQKIEGEDTSLEVKAVDLEQLLKKIADEFQSKWEENQSHITLHLEPVTSSQESFTIYSHGESVRRILVELLSNAEKYSHPNTTVEMMLSESVDHWICISIKNIGDGIAPSEKASVFERFRRGKGATQKAIPGTGLGLALVKSLVQHLRGTIDLDSKYHPDGVGETTFHVRLPRSLDNILKKEKS